jgi:hypothetical protein
MAATGSVVGAALVGDDTPMASRETSNERARSFVIRELPLP